MLYSIVLDAGIALPSDSQLASARAKIADYANMSRFGQSAAEVCYSMGLLSGYSDGRFGPQDTMTRAQAATVLCNTYDSVNSQAPDQDISQTDVPSTGGISRPAGAVGGHYDTSKYTVPADTNKDGWITSDEVQAVLDRMKQEYPSRSEWGEKTRYPGLYEYSGGAISGGLGSGVQCVGYAYMVSDQIFGNLPKREVSIEQLRTGDYMRNGPDNHSSIALCGVGEGKLGEFTSPTMYNTTDGNVSGKVGWGRARYAEDWPTGTHIWTRYPAE